MDNTNQPATGWSKARMWIALIITVIVLGIGVYFLLVRKNGTNTNNSNQVGNENDITNTVNKGSANVTVNPLTGWNQYRNNQQYFTIQYPTDWAAEFNQSDDNHGQFVNLATSTLSDIDLKDPWSRIYKDEAYIQIGVSDLTDWEWPPSLGNDLSFEEKTIDLQIGDAQQRVSVGYNHGINDGLFPNNDTPQLSSSVIFTTTEKLVWMRVFTGGNSREKFLQEFDSIIKTLQFD